MVDMLGLSIFLIGLGLIVVELSQPGYFIGVAGTVGIIVGLIQMTWPGFILGNALSPFIVVAVALASVWVSVEFYRRFAPASRAPETMSSDTLIGETGKLISGVDPDSLRGKVKISGIVWSATGDEAIEAGRLVRVVRVDGVKLIVEPLAEPSSQAADTNVPLEESEHV